MGQFAKPLEQLRHLFTQTAQAVVTTQEHLDEHLSTALSIGGQPNPSFPSYSIPRTEMDFQFGLEMIAEKGLFLIPIFRTGGGRLERHAHRLKFSLIAVSEVPSAPRGDLSVTTETRIPIRLIQPHFLISSEEQDALCLRVADAMDSGKWDFAFPEAGEKPTQAMVEKEAARIRKALKPDNPERGMVVFKMDTTPPSYLIVRVTDKSKKDGLFVFTPEPETEALIYSFEDDKVDNIRYRALHEFALTVRHWLAGAPPAQTPFPLPTPTGQGGASLGLGLIALGAFTQVMTEGYLSGLQFLSQQETAANAAKPLPSYYSLTDVEAELSYSVYYDEAEQRLKFSFGPRKKPDGEDVDDETSVIESRASIRAYRSDDAPRIDVELIMPEFALSGSAREFVLDAVKESAEKIASVFNEEQPGSYLTFLRNDVSRRGVVILLSYKGKTPQQKFLLIWPGMYLGQSRDFVFFCEMKNGKISADSIKVVLRLEQDLEPAGVAEGVEINGDQYQTFHNVFHAVRIWRSRVEDEKQ